MKNLHLSKAKTYLLKVCLLLLFIGCKNNEKVGYKTINNPIEKISNLYINHLNTAINHLDNIYNKPKEKQIENYKTARKNFKYIEPILAFTDKNNYKSLNAPNILKIEEEDVSDIKISNPIGFQVIEETLYEDVIDTVALKRALNITRDRLKLIKANSRLKFKNESIIRLIREQLYRIATTGITGFDSPVLGQSLLECSYTYETLQTILNLYASNFKDPSILDEFNKSIVSSKKILEHNFETFDRYRFIKNHIHPQLKLLVAIQKDWNVQFPFEMALSNNMTSLFSKETINLRYFTDHLYDTTQIAKKAAFGKALFNDKLLSKDRNISCASCHQQKLAFTDGKKTFDKNQTRNTPTLAYSPFQRGYFADSRAGSLEGQVISVVKNHNEFNMTMDSIIARVQNSKKYKSKLQELYGGKRPNLNIRHAIASYIRTLHAFNSKFDRNINDIENTLTKREINGFNLFTGKAQCATCHFAPVFNGTVPPNYKETEMELIGIPNKKDTINAQISTDLGRYYVFNTEERKHFFKTPTVRNIALTAPYMHNGVYNTLEEVVDFYNRGGGQGIGIDLPLQTLPADPLELTKKEQEDLVLFLKTLTDNTLVKEY